MPTYGYKCSACDGIFDLVCKIAERDTPTHDACPKCNATGTVARYFQDNHQQFTDSWSLGRLKPPEDWRNFLTKMKAANPGSDFRHG